MHGFDIALFSSFLFGPGNMVSAYLAGRGKSAGWVVLVIVQLGMTTFGVLTGYWGFVMNLGMAAIGVYNYRRWKKARPLSPTAEASP